MSEQQKAPIRDTQVDEILAQVEKKRASHGGRTPKASEAQLDAILKSARTGGAAGRAGGVPASRRAARGRAGGRAKAAARTGGGAAAGA